MHIFSTRIAAALALLVTPGFAGAAETAKFLNAPASAIRPAPKLAVQFELKLRLQEGKGLAQRLLDIGVDQKDAADAARLVAGHLGDGNGGCFAKVSISRASDGGAYSLVRVMITTEADQTVIERRAGELAIASQAPTRKTPRLV